MINSEYEKNNVTKRKFDEKNSIEISLTSTSDDYISTRISREISNMKQK